MRRASLLSLCLLFSFSVLSQTRTDVENPTKVVCDEQNATCSHKIVNGLTYKTLASPDALVTVSLADNGKATRLEVFVTNTGQAPFDLLPADIGLIVTEPKTKNLRMIPAEKIIASDRHRARWADALNAFGAGMATQPVTTQTTSTGTVQSTGSDGSYANGTYSGSSTSTTNVPDYAAQARAREVIRRRRAELEAHEAELERTVLRANTIEPGRAVGGFVFFESEKHGELYVVDIAVRGVVREFPIIRPKH